MYQIANMYKKKQQRGSTPTPMSGSKRSSDQTYRHAAAPRLLLAPAKQASRPKKKTSGTIYPPFQKNGLKDAQ